MPCIVHYTIVGIVVETAKIATCTVAGQQRIRHVYSHVIRPTIAARLSCANIR